MLRSLMTDHPLHTSDALARARALVHTARELSDEELGAQLGKAHRELIELRRKISDAATWCDALETEKDRRTVQKRA
jgi:hypothetical protein